MDLDICIASVAFCVSIAGFYISKRLNPRKCSPVKKRGHSSYALEDVVNLSEEGDNKRVYDCIVVGAGLSGLQSAKTLITNNVRNNGDSREVRKKDVLLIEAQSYIGGRIKQDESLVNNKYIDLGAELIHGGNNCLTTMAAELQEPLKKSFVWAQGDGGPLDHTIEGGYGLYYLKDCIKHTYKLLRFDDKDEGFVEMNSILEQLSEHDHNEAADESNVTDYLDANEIVDPTLRQMVAAGFSNTMCTNSDDLSLKQIINWERTWDEEAGDEEEDYRFENSYKCIVDYLKEDLNIALNCCVDSIDIIHKETTNDNSHTKTKEKLWKLTLRSKLKEHTSPDMDCEWNTEPTTIYTRSCIVTAPPKIITSKRLQINASSNTKSISDIHQYFETRNMFQAMKVIVSFKERCWPKNLKGMIMAGNDLFIPEVWFDANNEDDGVGQGNQNQSGAYYICTGFLTAAYASRLQLEAKARCSDADIGMSSTVLLNESMIKILIDQLDEIFSKLEGRHMDGDLSADIAVRGARELALLPLPSDVYKAGVVHIWDENNHPFIRGGYTSGKSGTYPASNHLFDAPFEDLPGLFFAGEGTMEPGATAHSALDSGKRAALLTKSFLTQTKTCEKNYV